MYYKSQMNKSKIAQKTNIEKLYDNNWFVEKTKKCRIEYRFFWKCTTKNTNTIIVYKEMMLYNLTRLNSSFWKVERSNAKNECY